ncbi:hypothetical protein WDU94_008781, partial [Cyamophila willieti]
FLFFIPDYTFFVPTDEAFEKAGLGYAPDSYLSKDTGLTVLLSHFVKGRLYARDLKENTTLESCSGYNLTVHNKQGTDIQFYTTGYSNLTKCKTNVNVNVLFLCGTVDFRGYHSITKSLITLLYLNQLNLSTLVMPPLVATHISSYSVVLTRLSALRTGFDPGVLRVLS